ncbi:LysR substrate-binding domain-containing protein [Mesorhizobium sp. MSK_1335]|uniref:LysR substrate-binding domain-containing protein n=1 Tax=Mesorhizobium montanum TaxID=3072323 RepID=A0ABU4ZY70_9HYPH|nr:LysR substrate-binding domain-containing protein [Mesorhizobium sp. MSK_1335]MDX8529254.1 LysR substrate-binding domain-containing protein [Mesorhizobium sp. MSK_1335]
MVHEAHPLAGRKRVQPQDLLDEELITVPVTLERLDIYTRFLVPANYRPRQHRTAETIDLMLQLVCAGRGVTVLPDWLLQEDASGLPIRALRLGDSGIRKSINLGVRRGEETTSYIDGFLKLAREMGR